MAKQILVTQATLPPFDEYVDEIRSIWETRWLTNMGQKHEALRSELKDYLGVEQIDLLVNGHMALELSMQALKLKGEVITTPFTFASTTHAIVRNGLTPVFCDVDPENFTMDVEKLESLVTDRTSAIVPVHVYGNICDVEGIQSVADKYGLKVIYDAAHTFGETYKGYGVGSFGDVSCFSFHATKVYNSIEGGAVCYSDIEFGQRLRDLKNFGIHDAETVEAVGANAKMNEFSAAMGLCNLRHVDEQIAKRAQVVARYRERLGAVSGIRLCPVDPRVASNYAYFPVVFDEKVFGASRNEVYAALVEQGITPRKYFYPLVSAFDCYRDAYDPSDTPVALYLSLRVLTLPLYPDLPLEDVDRMCDIVIGCQA
jgi:dTDP-4-amino-4,6-dideoxygalactose transaminase